jgi:hypothetical protein
MFTSYDVIQIGIICRLSITFLYPAEKRGSTMTDTNFSKTGMPSESATG